jgi:hypothetical protein
MAYTTSKAVGGLATVLSIGSTPVVVGEILSISQSGRSVKTDPTTNMQSTAEEFIPTLMSPGTYDVSFNRIGGDLGQVAMEAAFSALTTSPITIQEPKGFFTTSGPKYSFNAIVTELNYSYDPTKNIEGKAKLMCTGPITLTAGV